MRTRKVRIYINNELQEQVIAYMHRDGDLFSKVGYDQTYLWIIQIIIEKINTDIPWDNGICDYVIGEIDHVLSDIIVKTYNDLDDSGTVVEYCNVVEAFERALIAYMKTAIYAELYQTLEDCLEDYHYRSVDVVEVDYTMAKIVLELKYE